MKNNMKIEIIREGDIVSVGFDSESGASGEEVLNLLFAGVCGTIKEVAKQLEVPSDELMMHFLVPLVEGIGEPDEEA